MDFTLKKYSELLQSLLQQGYRLASYADYIHEYGTASEAASCRKGFDCSKAEEVSSGEIETDGDAGTKNSIKGQKIICLRHDVDLLPENSLDTARIEHTLGIRATYYFRAVPESWDEDVIRKIASLGHEIGYHYESLTTCDGDIDKAYNDFCRNLDRLRELVPVQTICMHGSPRSPFDSKDIWKKYSYRELGVIGEPYLDTDFSKCFYLTDTGRRWDGFKVSLRDRIEGWQERWTEAGLTYHRSDDIIAAAQAGTLPDRIMITTHPQRWTDNTAAWLKELVLQNAKNVVKAVKVRNAAGKESHAGISRKPASGEKNSESRER